MTAHRIRLFHSVSGADSYHGWLETWLTNMSPWAFDEVENTVPELRTDETGNEYYATELAFDWTEDKAIILDNLFQFAKSYCSWVYIGYHVCEHDEPNVTETTAETWVANTGSFVDLSTDKIRRGTVSVYPLNDPENTFQPSNYDIEFNKGKIMALDGGSLVDGSEYEIEYSHFQSGGPCYYETTREDGTVPEYVPSLTG